MSRWFFFCPQNIIFLINYIMTLTIPGKKPHLYSFCLHEDFFCLFHSLSFYVFSFHLQLTVLSF